MSKPTKAQKVVLDRLKVDFLYRMRVNNKYEFILSHGFKPPRVDVIARMVAANMLRLEEVSLIKGTSAIWEVVAND